MATQLQEDLAEALVKNKSLPKHKRKNKRDLLVSIGYAPSTAKKEAKVILESKGVQEAIQKQGLTESFIKDCLVYDIENKPKRRERELRLGAEILGITEHDKSAKNQTLIVIVSNETASRYAVTPTQNAS